ncbi:MAG: aquaporin Z [Kofleriaceae bacterium]|jgi:aquaporin Z|nr:aquaporin Z [Kofleriaceae bacterium]MBP6838377.1 aquaporin Z [Kofleriaceae bacterium]MBP9202815.1 aquaporin Z [Kofleriaceae bacterium]
MTKKLLAEVLGTFVLVFGGCGAAVFGGSHEAMGLTGVALAFGLTVVAMAYAVGHVSGGHFNPAVTLGLVAAGRHPAREAGPYIGAQLIGAVAAAGALAFLLKDAGAPSLGQFAANGWGAEGMHNGVGLGGALVAEVVTTFVFVLVILGVTSTRAPTGFAPLAIGLTLTLIHLVTIPLTNTSVNPARSTSQALFAGGVWLEQAWLFWLAPIAGAAAAGLLGKYLFAED